MECYCVIEVWNGEYIKYNNIQEKKRYSYFVSLFEDDENGF